MDLTDDDRATLLGALMEVAGRLRGPGDGEDPAHLRARWRHAGLRAFHEEREAAAAAGVGRQAQDGMAPGGRTA